MAAMKGRRIQWIIPSLLLVIAEVYSEGSLLPYGVQHGDEIIQNVHDPRLFRSLKNDASNLSCPFFGEAEDRLYIGANGVLSFRHPSSSIVPPHIYPPAYNRSILATNHTLIAPYWTSFSDNDIAGVVRQIFYRYSDNQTLLNETASHINAAFQDDFAPSFLFIATWIVNRPRSTSNRTNTFQAVVATDGQKTFIFFHYQDIQYRREGETAVGFSAGDEIKFFTLPESTIIPLYNLERYSNFDRPGSFIFRVDQEVIMEPSNESVTLHVSPDHDTYIRLQEPDFGNSTIATRVCATAQISRPLRRLVVFDFRWNNMSTADFHDKYSNRLPGTRDFSVPILQPFAIYPGTTDLVNECFNVTIYGDDNIEPDGDILEIVLRPVSPLDSVNFTANNTITIVIEDNLSFLQERLLPFGEAHGDEVIESRRDSNLSQPHSTDISNLRFRFYNMEQEAIYISPHGLLSFRAPSNYIYPRVVPPVAINPPLRTNYTLIAPLWQYTTLRPAGRILYRYSDNQTLLNRIGFYINNAFDGNFSPGLLFLTTWDKVKRYDLDTQINTFQAVVATDGMKTFVLFLYGDIQTVNYDYGRVVMGFSAGDMVRSFTVPECRSHHRYWLRRIERTSNVGRPSTFIFRVDQQDITSSPRSRIPVVLDLDIERTNIQTTLIEPPTGDFADVDVCVTAQLDRPIERLVLFEYYFANLSTATPPTDVVVRRQKSYDPEDFFIEPGFNGTYRKCITVVVIGDDIPERNETAIMVFTPLSNLDRLNFGPSITINIIDNSNALVEGVDYLEFLDLQSENTVDVSPNSIEPLNGGDYYSNPIVVRAGIPIGARSQLTQFLYVLSDGAITNRPISLSTPLTFPPDSDLQIVAPFLTNHATIPGSVSYRVYTGVTDEIIMVSNFTKNMGFPGDFVGNWMLVAEWRNLPGSYPGADRTKRNTYQAIIISDGRETFAVYTYNCDQLNWIGNDGNSYAAIGYNVLVEGSYTLQSNLNYAQSRSQNVGSVACSNRDIFGVHWSNLVYRIGISTNDFQLQRSRCLARVSRDEELYPIPSSSLNDPSFLKDRVFGEVSLYAVFLESGIISDCPCTLMQAERDNRFGYVRRQSHLGGNICYFSRLSALYAGVSFSYRCCYSEARGTLVTADPSGHGSIVVLTSLGTSSSGSEYVENTLGFQNECCGAGLCDLFYSRRIPTTCSSYTFATFTWALGDPHITTLDGANYTFNGWGEYTLTQLGDFVLQGRTTAVDTSAPGSATQFSAFAFGLPNATIEVQLQNDGLHLLLNSEDITDTIPAPNDTNANSTLVFLERKSSNSILSSFINGVSITVTQSFDILNFVASIPQEYQGFSSILGLLGNYNGDSSDDLMYVNGTMIAIDSPYDMVHEFGQSWLIDPAYSLFTYPSGMSAADFSFPDHVPLSVDDVVTGASQEVRDSCQGNVKCIFDATQTGNLEIGLNTMQTEDVFIEDQRIASNNPPNITGPDSHVVTLNQEASFDISVVDTDLVSFTIISGDVDGGVLSRDSRDPLLHTFTWTPRAIIQNPIVFLATDELGASSQYEPQIEFCQCLNGAECTLQGVLNQLANPVDLNCFCAPGFEGRYCGEDTDGCRDLACLEGVQCTDNPAPAEGATCGPCPPWFSGTPGRICSDPVMLPEVVKDNVIRVTLGEIEFAEEEQFLFKQVTAQAINMYCTQNQCVGNDEMILISNVQGNNVFLISISRDARSRVNFEMYVALYNGTFLLLNRQDLYQAVQMNAEIYIRAGFQATFHPYSSGSSPSAFWAAIIPVIGVSTVIVTLVIISSLCYWCKVCRDRKAAIPSDVKCNMDEEVIELKE